MTRWIPTPGILVKLAVLATAFCCALTLSVPASAPAAQAQSQKRHKKPPKPKPIYWGMWIGKQVTGESPPFDMNPVSILSSMLGKGMSLVEFSSPFADCRVAPCAYYRFPSEGMERIRTYGAIPVFSWAAESSPRRTEEDPEFQLADILEGRYDTYIREFAEEARNWGRPYFLRFNWEMNGNWFSWSEGINGNTPGQYVAAWRHVHDIFTSVGATNATWVWCPFADPKKRFNKLKPLYPGDGYVDWTCLDGYNWGRNPVNSKPWRNFNQIFETTYQKVVKKIAPKKPMLLGEFGTSPYGGHKAVWIRNMLSVIPKKYPRIRGLVYLDGYDRGIDWPIESSAAVLTKFARGIRRPIFVANNYADLAASPIPPP
jgi:hypothetical protein